MYLTSTNCSKYQHRKNEILGSVDQTNYPGAVVCAIPDPHIDRWYIADPEAFSLAIGSSSLPKLPSYKCERGRYKKAMRDAFADASILAPFGGAEYGPEIAERLDLYKAGKTDSSFRHFVEDLRQALIPD